MSSQGTLIFILQQIQLAGAHDRYSLPDIYRNRLLTGDEVSEKTHKVVVPFIMRQPGYWTLVIGDLPTDQCGFSKAGWCRNEGKLGLYSFVQLLNQTRPKDNF